MIKFEMVTLGGVKFGEPVYEIMLPTPDGQIAILPHHIPLVSLVTTGVLAIRRQPNDRDDKIEYYAVNGGVVEILDNEVRLLVDEADHAEDIDEAEAAEAHKKAVELAKAAKDKLGLDEAQSLMDLHATRIKVAELKRHRKSRY